MQDICKAEDIDLYFGLNGCGMPYFIKEGHREIFDFNQLHADYFPKCSFTAVARAGELFYLAGIDDEGVPHVFSSLMGGVWEERNLSARQPVGGVRRPTGPIIKILFDPEENQTFLVCKNGQIVTLPDCPKCVKLQDTGLEIKDAQLSEGNICLTSEDGKIQRLLVRKVAQYRVSESYAQEQCAQGAVIVDLRSSLEFATDHLPGAMNIPDDSLDFWLANQPKERMLIFVCRTGNLADQAVRYARSLGYMQSFSLGGMLEVARIR